MENLFILFLDTIVVLLELDFMIYLFSVCATIGLLFLVKRMICGQY